MLWLIFIFCPPLAVLFKRGPVPALITALGYIIIFLGSYLVGWHYMTKEPKKKGASLTEGLTINIVNQTSGEKSDA